MMMTHMSREGTAIITLRHTPLLETHNRIQSILTSQSLWNMLVHEEDRFLHWIVERWNDVLETVHAIKHTLQYFHLPLEHGSGGRTRERFNAFATRDRRKSVFFMFSTHHLTQSTSLVSTCSTVRYFRSPLYSPFTSNKYIFISLNRTSFPK